MQTQRLSRIATLLLALLFAASAPAQTLTAAQAWLRIQHLYAKTPPPDTADAVDTLKAGDPATPVAGIATTFLDTMDVLREAARPTTNSSSATSHLLA